MKKEDFKAHAYLGITNDIVLQIMLVREDGEDYVYSTYVKPDGALTTITKAYVRFTSRGVPHFLKDSKRYYLDDFMKY